MSLTIGALLEVGLFITSPVSAGREESTSPDFQAASEFRCRLAGDTGFACISTHGVPVNADFWQQNVDLKQADHRMLFMHALLSSTHLWAVCADILWCS